MFDKIKNLSGKILDSILIKEDFDDDYDDDSYLKELEEQKRKQEKEAEKQKEAIRLQAEERIKARKKQEEKLEKEADKKAEKAKRAERTEKKDSKGFGFINRLKDAKEYDLEEVSKKAVYKDTSSSTQGLDKNDIAIEVVKSFADTQYICDLLLDGYPVIVNFSDVDSSLAQRIMDFVSGCVYAVDGNINMISDNIYLLAPDNIDISDEYISLLQGSQKGSPAFNKMI